MHEHIFQKNETMHAKVTQMAPKGRPCLGICGPGVPVRGKEFLPETPGSGFAVGKTSSCKQTSSKHLKSKTLKITAPPPNTHWCARGHGADLLIYWAPGPPGLRVEWLPKFRVLGPPCRAPASRTPFSGFQHSIFWLLVSNFEM